MYQPLRRLKGTKSEDAVQCDGRGAVTNLVTHIRSYSDNGEQDYEWEERPKGGHLENSSGGREAIVRIDVHSYRKGNNFRGAEAMERSIEGNGAMLKIVYHRPCNCWSG